MINDKMQRRKGRQKILFICLGASLTLHLGALFVVYKNPYLLRNADLLTFSRSSLPLPLDEEHLSSLEKDNILEEVFEQLQTRPVQFHKPFDSEPASLGASLQPFFEEVAVKASSTLALLPVLEEPSLTSSDDWILSPPSSSPELIQEAHQEQLSAPPELKNKIKLYPLPTLAQEGYLEDPSPGAAVLSILEEPSEVPYSGELREELPSVASSSLPLEVFSSADKSSSKQPLMAFRAFHEPLVEEPHPGTLKQIYKNHPLAQVESYVLPDISSMVNWDDHFNIDVQVAADPEGSGYIFSLALTPIAELKEEQMKQNFYFLIDRSNSIDKQRFQAFKKATMRALASLKEGDYFNIIVFERKIKRLSEKNLPVTKRSILVAEEFLAKEEYGGLFAATEIYPLLEKVIPSDIPDNEVHTALLLTDGKTLLNLKKQQRAILEWTETNSGKVCLYTAAAGIDNNLTLLDLLSTCNRGSLIYSRTQAAFPRKLIKAISSLRAPLVKDINLQAIALKTEHQVQLYPPGYRSPTLYQKQPYIIVGKTDKLSNFTLLMDGRNGDRLITMKKEIVFTEAKKGKALLEKRWAIQDAHVSYEQFLKDGKKDHLKKAQETLKAYGGELAFE